MTDTKDLLASTFQEKIKEMGDKIEFLEEENDKLKKENGKLIASCTRYYEAEDVWQKEKDEWREAVEKFTDRFWKLKKADDTKPKLLFKGIDTYITKLKSKKDIWKRRAKALNKNYLTVDGYNIAVALHRINNINYYRKCYSGLGMTIIIELELEYKKKIILEYDDERLGMHIFHTLKADWEEYLASREKEND